MHTRPPKAQTKLARAHVQAHLYTNTHRRSVGPRPRRLTACASSAYPAITSGIHEWKYIQLSNIIYSKAYLIRVIHMLIHMLTAGILHRMS